MRLRAYERGDERAIQALYVSTFARDRTMAEWRWRFRDAPAGPALVHLLEDDEGIAGHIAHVPFDSFVNGSRACLAHGGDTMVHARAQRRGGMRLLVEGFLAADHGVDLRINFPTDHAAVLMARYGGGRHLGRIPQWVRWHTRAALAASRGRPLPPPAATAVTAALDAGAFAAHRLGGDVTVSDLDDLGDEVDALAQESASFARCIRVRDAAYLRWRWLDSPRSRCSLLGAWRRERLVGVAVYGVDGQHGDGSPFGRIVDLLAVDSSTARSLLATAADALARRGCGVVAADLADPRPWSRRACRTAGFVPRGLGPNVTARSLSERAGDTPERLEHWYLTRGDTDLV